MKVCGKCGGGGVLCSRVGDTTMRCPEPAYDDEFDLLGVCPHLTPCPVCNRGGSEMMPQSLQDVEKILLSVLNDREIGEIMYRRRTPSGAPLLNEYRNAVHIAIEALVWRKNNESVLRPDAQS